MIIFPYNNLLNNFQLFHDKQCINFWDKINMNYARPYPHRFKTDLIQTENLKELNIHIKAVKH